MKNRDITWVMKLRDSATPAFNKFKGNVTKGTGKMKQGFQGLGNTIRNAFIATAAIAFFKKTVDLYAEQERATIRLRTALRGVGEDSDAAQKAMTDYAAALQKVTTFGDETIINVQAMLIQMTGLNTTAVRPLTEAVLDMATAHQMDARMMARYVAQTINGQTALKTYGVDIGAVTGQLNRVNAVLNGVRGSVGGLAREMATTALGQLDQFKAAWSDMMEPIGKVTVEGLVPMLRTLTPILSMIGAVVVLGVGGFTAFITVLASLVNVTMAAFFGFKALKTGATQDMLDMKNAWEAAKLGFMDVADLGYLMRKSLKESMAGIVDHMRNTGLEAGNAYNSGVIAAALTSAEAQLNIATKYGGDMLRINEVDLDKMHEQWARHVKKVADEMKKLKGTMHIVAVSVALNMKSVAEQIDEEITAMVDRTISVLWVLTTAMRQGFDAAFSGQEDAFRAFIKALLGGIIDLVQGMLFAATAAAWLKGVLLFGTTIASDIAAIIGATAALQLARAVVNSMHQGGTAFIDAPASREVPILVRGQETVRVTTPEQEAERGTGRPVVNVTINNHSDMTAVEGIKKAVEEGLRKTGLTADQFFVANPRAVTL